MAKSAKRKKEQKAKKAAKKRSAMLRGGGNSKYAQKKREQANGRYRPTSPFRIEVREPVGDDMPEGDDDRYAA